MHIFLIPYFIAGQAKKLVNSNKSKKFFMNSEFALLAFLKLQKMEFGQKKLRAKLNYLILRVFLAWTFFNFLAHCVWDVGI